MYIHKVLDDLQQYTGTYYPIVYRSYWCYWCWWPRRPDGTDAKDLFEAIILYAYT
jgi:hypothetical protein